VLAGVAVAEAGAGECVTAWSGAWSKGWLVAHVVLYA
jgi:hypothetical protein